MLRDLAGPLHSAELNCITLKVFGALEEAAPISDALKQGRHRDSSDI